MTSKIDPELAKSLKKEFQDSNEAAGEHAWKTADGHFLKGFYIDRESIESLLKDEKVAGIHVYFAKHPDFVGKPDKVHTLTVSGSVPNSTPGEAPFVATGDVISNVPPCPTMCLKS